MRARLPLAAALLATTVSAQADPSRQLTAAKAESAAAIARAARLDRAAANEADAARQAKLAEAALGARIAATQADIAAAEARATLVGRLVRQQRARLAAGQGPVARLVAALQALAARPTLAALVQPGSIDDLVHVRAALGAAIPAVRARTAGVRADLDRARALGAGAALAARTLRAGRAKLEGQRLALVRLEAQHRLRSGALGRDAGFESDRALALGERARDIVGALTLAQDAAAVEARLVSLPGPLPRPPAADAANPTDEPAIPAAVYRLPVAGRVVTGLGEISDAGVRSRGLTFATAAGARVLAPAGGHVRYAGRFRDYGRVVVIDHGAGWTSALIGLDRVEVATGDRVRAGDRVGQAGAVAEGGDDPRVTVELRRRGRPVDPTALL